MTDYAPSFRAARLYEKVSKNGATYYTGRMGGVKIALVRSKEISDDGSPIWNLLFSEAPERQRPSEERPPAKRESQAPAERPFDDSIPF